MSEITEAQVRELKPCPFCGGEAQIVGGPEDWSPTFNDPDSGGDPIAVVCKNCNCGLYCFEDYEEAIAAWNRRADGWIPVEERLPEKDTLVLLYLENENHSKITTGKIYTSDDPQYNGEFCTGFDALCPVFLKREYITHWMPLPQPPKEAAHER